MKAALLPLILLLGACIREFPTDAPRAVSLAPGRWRDTFSVRDVDTLRLAVTDSARGETITGVNVAWESSDSSVLALAPFDAPAGADAAAASAARLSIVARARRRGTAVVRTRVEQPGFSPRQMELPVVVRERWIAVTTGNQHSCALTADSLAYCWGLGILGGGQLIDTSTAPVEVIDAFGPVKLALISAGSGWSTCGLRSSGSIVCWGFNFSGLFGAPLGYNVVAGPGPAGVFQALSVGGVHTCGSYLSSPINPVGAACWGRNAAGALGAGLNVDSIITAPTTIRPLTGPPRLEAGSVVATGAFHSCALSPAGVTRCWGAAASGQLGAGAPADSCAFSTLFGGTGNIPCSSRAVVADSTRRFRQITAGGYEDLLNILGSNSPTSDPVSGHACGITASGQAWCWGHNGHGQLGAASTDQCSPAGTTFSCSLVPVQAAATGGLAAITAGGWHTCALTYAGQAVCWGNNAWGQVGDGSASPQSSPGPVTGGGTYSSISAGSHHTCAIAARDGGIWCWGRNTYAQLGATSSGDYSASPVRVREPAR